MFLRRERRKWLALGMAGLAAVVVAVFVHTRKPDRLPPPAERLSPAVAPAEPAVAGEDPSDGEAGRGDDRGAAAPAPPSFADVMARCADLLRPDAPSALVLLADHVVAGPADWPPPDWPPNDWRTSACGAAQDSYFGPSPVAETWLPLADPMAWRDVFDDPAGKVEAVASLLSDPACVIPDEDFRPDLHARCEARTMAEVDVFKEACNTVVPYAARGRMEVGVVTMADWQPGNNHKSHLNERNRANRLEWIRESSESQEEYRTKRRAADEWHLRTKWLEVACLTRISTVHWMNDHQEHFGGLMARAAGLGDAFALAHAPLTRARALALRDHDPVSGYVHLALIDSEAALAEGRQANEAYRMQRLAPFKESRRRIVALAGLECASPCADEELRRLEGLPKMRQWRMFCRIQGKDCDAFEELQALRAKMAPAFEGDHRHRERNLPFRQKAERIKMAHQLAIESLAAARGVKIPPMRWMGGDPEILKTLDPEDFQLAREHAARLVAEASPERP